MQWNWQLRTKSPSPNAVGSEAFSISRPIAVWETDGILSLIGNLGKNSLMRLTAPKNNENRCSEFAHEVRRIKQVQDFKNTEPNQKICRKNPSDIHTADLENFFSCYLHPEEECDSNEKNGKRTRVNAVENGGQQDEWQKPCALIAQVPDEQGGS